MNRNDSDKIEFSGIRSKLYKECLREYPNARDEDIKVMLKYLNPKNNEKILEVGAGSGFFSKELSKILINGKLVVSDPSKEQLDEVLLLNQKNVSIVEFGADELDIKEQDFDAVWSFGAMHHCFNKSKAFQNLYKLLKKGGRLVIADVWQGSKLAKHFDDKVAKYCVSGHEVSFFSDEFVDSLCFLYGFQKPKIYNLKIKWKFQKKEEIGTFLFKLHAMTKSNPEDCLKGADEILGIEQKNGTYNLNWPMKVMIAKKK